MLSAVAPMSMSEERQRGSLDLLAATTLSTPTIVLGKWLGTLRLVAAAGDRAGTDGIRPGHGTSRRPSALPARRESGPTYYEELSRGALLFGAGLLVATILVHGR